MSVRRVKARRYQRQARDAYELSRQFREELMASRSARSKSHLSALVSGYAAIGEKWARYARIAMDIKP